jgi:hypothetical protein
VIVMMMMVMMVDCLSCVCVCWRLCDAVRRWWRKKKKVNANDNVVSSARFSHVSQPRRGAALKTSSKQTQVKACVPDMGYGLSEACPQWRAHARSPPCRNRAFLPLCPPLLPPAPLPVCLGNPEVPDTRLAGRLFGCAQPTWPNSARVVTMASLCPMATFFSFRLAAEKLRPARTRFDPTTRICARQSPTGGSKRR